MFKLFLGSWKAPALEESELLTLSFHLNGHQSLLDKLDHCPT